MANWDKYYYEIFVSDGHWKLFLEKKHKIYNKYYEVSWRK